MRNTYTIRIQSGKRSKKIIENEIVGEIVHVKEKRIIQKEKSVNGVMG